MRKLAFLCLTAIFGLSMLSASAQQHIPSVEWDRYSLIIVTFDSFCTINAPAPKFSA